MRVLRSARFYRCARACGSSVKSTKPNTYMEDVKTAAAIACWLESNPNAAKELVRHLNNPVQLLALREHFPDEFESNQMDFKTAFTILDQRYDDAELVQHFRQALVTLSARPTVTPTPAN